MIYKIFFFLTLILSLISCTNNSETSQPLPDAKNDSLIQLAKLEAIEDSLELKKALKLQQVIKASVTPDAETMPVASMDGEDAADDPAIWINKNDPSKSLILGTNKVAGLYVYDLDGNEKQYRKIGRINNVDLRDGFSYNGQEVVLVAGSNRSLNSVTLLYLNPETGELSDTLANIRSHVDEVYGICLYHDSNTDQFYVFVNGKGGSIEQWELHNGEGITATMVRNFTVGSQPEGMVANDKTGILYFGVEEEGIFKVSANPVAIEEPVMLPQSDSTNKNIVYDIEGLALFSYKNKDYLLASSQGNFSYAIFSLDDPVKYLASFTIGDSREIDGAEETDGLEIAVYPLNKKFPLGVLVVQDGFNYDGDSIVNQNFKIISFQKVLGLLE